MHKTKEYITLVVILFIASLFLLFSISDSNKITGNVISDLELTACTYADDGGTCFTQLPLLHFITPEECCEEVQLCCRSKLELLDEFTITYEIQNINDPALFYGYELPEGYSIIYGPFNVICQAPTDLIINIPIKYEDAKILRCQGEQCYLNVIKKITKTQLGDFIVNVTEEIEEFKPNLIELEKEEIRLTIKSFRDLIQSGGTEFYGEFFENLTKILYPNQSAEDKDELEIIGGPFTYNKDEIKGTINLPYNLRQNIHGQAIGLFIKKDDKWVPVGSAIDPQTMSILANIDDISELIDQENVSLAIMGVKIYPTNVTLNRVYVPEPYSRDAVILVHGLATIKETFKYLIQDIKETNQPFQVWKFSYSSTRYIDEIAEDLSEALEENIDKYDRIFIVAHSLGGIIAQQALYKAYDKGYSYVEKVKKVILIGTPNEGSVVAEAYEYLFSSLVQKSIGLHQLFHINKKFVSDLVKGRIIPQVPGVDYYVIAGTRPYTEGLIGLISKKVPSNIKFDGVVSTKSAQNIGGKYINDMCRNYWEVNITHMELVDDYISRQIIGKIIAEAVAETKKQATNLGDNYYYKIRVEDCSSDIFYLAIGKKVSEKPIEDATGCSCGDGYCGVGETLYNCPSDCAEFFAKRNMSKLPLLFLVFFFIILGIALFEWKKTRQKNQ